MLSALSIIVHYFDEQPNIAVPSVTGGHPAEFSFVPERPKTWPHSPAHYDSTFHEVVARIFRETMVSELRNVVDDILKANAVATFPLAHRGHVIAVAYMCALDAVSAYGYKGNARKWVAKFVRNHFPVEYQPHANRIYPHYRLSLVHEWNLSGDVALLPDDQPIRERDGQLEFGILSFRDAFEFAVDSFIRELAGDQSLQKQTLNRYREVVGEVEREVFRPKTSSGLKAVGMGLGILIAGLVGFVISRKE